MSVDRESARGPEREWQKERKNAILPSENSLQTNLVMAISLDTVPDEGARASKMCERAEVLS